MGESTYEALWGRAFANLYDAAFVLAERRGFREVRRALVSRAAGRVVELGAGTGLNVEHYTPGVSTLLLTEPDPHMIAKLRTRVTTSAKEVVIAQAPAEEIPTDDASVDCVVCTLVLCTVADPNRVLREVARVLRPGGVFLFAEHVRSNSARVARWQDRLNRPWGWYACGCHCNRDTVSSVRESPLRLGGITADRLRWVGPLVRPLVTGVAVNEGTS